MILVPVDNGSVNYDKRLSVFWSLKKVNDRIIAANCPALILHNAAKVAVNKMAVDVEVLVQPRVGFLDNGEEYYYVT